MEEARAECSREICPLLRWKSMFYEPDSGPGDGPCWCVDTQKVVGPDGQPVTAETCDPGRSCYNRE